MEQIEGFFLSFTPKEMVEIRHALERKGFAADSDGLKSAVMSALFTESPRAKKEAEVSEAERLIRMTREFVEKNPTTIQFGMAMAGGMIRNAMKKVKL